jgi:hypothetical protein
VGFLRSFFCRLGRRRSDPAPPRFAEVSRRSRFLPARCNIFFISASNFCSVFNFAGFLRAVSAGRKCADGDHGEAVHDGAPSAGDATAAGVELQPRPRGTALPHAQRLLLPPSRGHRAGGIFRRRADAARAGGGPCAVLPDGGAPRAGRGREGRNRLQRRGRALRRGRRARHRRQRLRRLRAHHGPEAPHPGRRLHRRHLGLPAPSAPGDLSS